MSQGKMSDEEALQIVAAEVGKLLARVRHTEGAVDQLMREGVASREVAYSNPAFDAARRQAYALERVLDLAREQVAVSKKR